MWIPVALLVGILLGGFLVFALSQQTLKISTVCTIKAVGVGVYSDVNCTLPVTSIDWGIMEPGQTKGVTVFIRNEGNVPSTLNITTEAWNPENAPTYITFSNNYDGRVLNPNDVVQTLFTLTVNKNITGIKQFSFTILVTILG